VRSLGQTLLFIAVQLSANRHTQRDAGTNKEEPHGQEIFIAFDKAGESPTQWER
jgi:hypothetical protein